MPHIIKDYQDKCEHDLLIELVVQGNSSVEQDEKILKRLDTLNGSVQDNTTRSLDNQRILSERTVPLWLQSKWRVGGIGTGIIALVTVLCRVAEKLIGGI